MIIPPSLCSSGNFLQTQSSQVVRFRMHCAHMSLCDFLCFFPLKVYKNMMLTIAVKEKNALLFS